MLKREKSEVVLLLAAAIWGFAFIAQRAGMNHVGPFTFTAARFALGSALLAVVLRLRRRKSPVESTHLSARKALSWAALIGVVLFLAASAQQIGIKFTTAGKAGFITGLYVVIVPLLGLLLRQRPPTTVWLGAVAAAGGLYLLCITSTFTISRGDALVLLCAFLFAGHVLLIGHFSDRIDPLFLACVQFGVCSLVSFVFAFALETVSLRALARAALPILYGGLISAGIGYTLQIIGQKNVPPAHASIIMSLEAVFAVVGGYLASLFKEGFADEILSVRALAGCLLMLCGMLLAQIPKRSSA